MACGILMFLWSRSRAGHGTMFYLLLLLERRDRKVCPLAAANSSELGPSNRKLSLVRRG